MAMSKTENNWAIALLFLIIFTVPISADAAENAAPKNLNYFSTRRGYLVDGNRPPDGLDA